MVASTWEGSNVNLASGWPFLRSASCARMTPRPNALTYPSVARASITGSTLTITGVASGTATITVTARDPGGLEATQTMDVGVEGTSEAPETVGSIPNQTISEGESTTIDASSYFRDPDGNQLSYSATSSDGSTATVAVSGSTVTIEGVAHGTTTITVTASDPDGLRAKQHASVTVRAVNQAPVALGTIPDRIVSVGAMEDVDVSSYFSDPDGDALSYRATSSNTGVARATASGSTVTIAGVARGTATITVTARDPGGLEAPQNAMVSVASVNEAPVAVGSIPAQSIDAGRQVSLRATSYFNDPDADPLEYEAATSNDAVATATAAGGTVVITGAAEGNAIVTVTARDPAGLTATQRANVSVGAANQWPVAEGTIPEQTVKAGATAQVDLSSYFTDPDGDNLDYAASSFSETVATVSVSAAMMTIAGVAAGNTRIAVTATDPDGLDATHRTRITVEPDNRAPEAVGAIPAETVTEGATGTVDVSSFFSDPDGDPLNYLVATSDANVVTATVSGNTVTITGIGDGTGTVTVTARDPRGLEAEQELWVTVEAVNHPPETRGTIAARTVDVGGMATVNVSSYFNDPDGNTLGYRAATSDGSVATVATSGAVVTISGVAKGAATITVAARDPGGLEATQTISVTVPNRSPETRGAIPAQTVGAGATATVDIASHFDDPDGDALGYTATSSDPNTATASASGAAVTITGVADGIAMVTVTARDPDGLEATQQISVSVGRTNQAPVTTNTIPAQVVSVGASRGIRLFEFFGDPDGDALGYAVSSSDENIVLPRAYTRSMSLSGVTPGIATVTVTARDPGGLEATQQFGVTVVGNRAPEAVGRIPAESISVGGGVGIEVSSYFTDPDTGDRLTYSAATSNQNVLSVSVNGSRVTVTGVGPGAATVTVTARDSGGLEGTQSFEVTVEDVAHPPQATGAIFAQAVAPGESVTLNVSSYFFDPDRDQLEYNVATSNPGMATASVSGDLVTVSGVSPGSVTLTVTARDPGHLEATQNTAVAVLGAPGQFTIQLHFGSRLKESHAAAFQRAAERWMSILAGTELRDMSVEANPSCPAGTPGRTVDDLIIGVRVEEIDGPGRDLGAAGPCFVRTPSYMPYQGQMRFDVADLDRLEERNLLEPTILHEMGHVLGIGTLWGLGPHEGLLANPSLGTNVSVDTHFTGVLSLRAFDEAGGTGYGAAKVPVENCANRYILGDCRDRPGSDDGHWRESVLDSELMTPFISRGASPLSAITIQSLADLGYTVDTSEADSYRLPDAAVAPAEVKRRIFLGNDILPGPIFAVDESGRVTQIIPR